MNVLYALKRGVPRSIVSWHKLQLSLQCPNVCNLQQIDTPFFFGMCRVCGWNTVPYLSSGRMRHSGYTLAFRMNVPWVRCRLCSLSPLSFSLSLIGLELWMHDGKCALNVLFCTISSNMREKSKGLGSKLPCCAARKKFWMRTSVTYRIRAANKRSLRWRSQ